MSANKHKPAIRARMAATGESYTAARARYLEERGLPQTTATSATTARKRTAEIVAEYGEHLGLDAPAAPVVVTRSSGRQQERP